MDLNIKEIKAKILSIPKDSLVMIDFPKLDVIRDKELVVKMLEFLNRVGEKHDIDFIYMPAAEITIIKKEKA